MKIKIEGIKPHELYSGEKIIELLRDVDIEIAPEVRKYDWSKTLEDILVIPVPPTHGLWRLSNARDCGVAIDGVADEIWQPNIHGKCPVDPDASLVELRLSDGTIRKGMASDFRWVISSDEWHAAIIGWRFVRLAEGYEW